MREKNYDNRIEITVIIPAYNCEKTIGSCVDSVLEQSLKSIQIIVVDDGSKDSTRKILFQKGKGDGRIEVVRQENKGPSEARNKGIELARGRFLSFVDADDIILPGMFQFLLNYQKEYGADLTISGIRRVIKNNKKKDSFRNVDLKVDGIHYYNDKEDIKTHFIDMLTMGVNSPVGRLYKKDIIDRYNIKFDKELDMGEDLQFNIDYIERSNSILFVPDVFYQYNTFDSALTFKYREDLFQQRKKSVVRLEQYLQRNAIDRNIVYYLYIKLVYAEAMQEIRHKTGIKDRRKKIRINLNSDEITMVKKLYQTEKLSERILYFIIQINSPYLIDFISRFFIKLQDKGNFLMHRISV